MKSVRSWLALALVALPLASASAQPLQEFYIPLPEEEILLAAQVLDGTLTDTDIRTVISITAAGNNTIIYYDHWEDGYDADITMPPGGSTTEIWGDANPANGFPPGLPGDVINAGTVITLANTVPSSPRVPANIFFDGRDKIGTTQLVAITQAGWPLPTSTVIAGAIEVFSTNDWGIHYTAPGGEGFSEMFEDARFIIMAERDSTIVRVDIDNDGTDDIIQTLNEGEVLRVDGVLVGTQVHSNLPIQTNFLTGDIGVTYEQRWYSMVPRTRWESEYIAPVGTTVVGDEAVVLLYNPHGTDLDVDVTTTGGTATVTIPAGGIFRYFMPVGSGARFVAPDARDFFAIAAIDDESTTHDWGHTLLPVSTLTPAVKAGWAPGSDNPAAENSSPIWITSEADTTLDVDWDDDGVVDLVVPILAFQSIQLYDPDGDQTGTRVRTQDGTLISAAWGQDPSTASPASPALDLGTTVLPIPDIYILKNSSLASDVNGNGLPDPGDTLLYTLFVLNTGVADADNVTIVDTPDPYTSYVTGTTSTLNLGAIPDDVLPSTPFPLDETGLNIGTLTPNQSDTLSYERQIGDPLPSPQQIIVNTALVTINTGTTSSSSEVTPVTPPQFGIVKSSDVVGSALPGDTVEYTITIENTSALTQTGITVTDPVPSGTTYVAESTTATGPGNAETFRDEFNALSYANNDGTANWATNWLEMNDDNNINGSDIRVLNDSGALRLMVRDDNNGAQREADLSAFTSATLSFNYRRNSLDAIGEWVAVRASNNGGATWTELARFAGPATDAGYTAVSYDISGFISNNTRISFFSAPSGMSNGDQVYFDEIEISAALPPLVKTNQAAAPPANALVDGNPQDLVLAGDGYSLNPGEIMTVTYRVVIDDPLTPYLPAITNVVTVDSVESLAPAMATRLDPVAPGSTIGDRVWLDVDGDGVQDVGEVGLSNVRVDLIWDPDGIPGNGDEVVADTTLTDGNGSYLFTGIYPPASGTYYALVDAATLPAGLTPSPGNNGGMGASRTITGSDTFLDDDFGYTAPAGTAVLGDRVWSDADNDGIQDPGEVGLGGVSVSLTDLVGTVIATTTTAADGTYLFIGVAPGDYRVDIGAGIPPGYTLTVGPQSSPDPTTPITVGPGDIDISRDFGYYNSNLYSISDSTWNDADDDGVRDPGELGIGGVTVNLLDGGGAVIATTVSDANGDFVFAGVVGSGGGVNYTIDISDTGGVLTTLATTTPAAAAGQLGVTVFASNISAESFGYLTLGRIGRYLWSDTNGDGIQDPGESGIGGVTVDLVIAGLDGTFGTADDSVFATTTTAADGSYLFDAVPRGYYQTQVTDTGAVLAGSTQTGDPDAVLDAAGDVPLLTGATDFTMNFGYQNAAFADVSGTVFDDTDIDGVQDAGELGIAGVTIDLIAAGPDGIYGTLDDLLVATTTTDVNGDYNFVDVPPGSYRSTVTDVGNILNGYTLTSGLDEIDVAVAGVDITDVDFGYVRTPGTGAIGNSVWLDANRDGVYNPSENGIANATVNLYSTGPDRVIGGGDDVLVATAITDLFGNYLFTSLAAGDYYVDVVDASIPAGLSLTGTATDPTAVIPLSDGGRYVDADFGYASAVGSAIGDTVFYDANGDGIQDPGEVGIGGVTVTVFDSGGGSTVTVTAADGTWLVPGLPPGNTTVNVDSATLPPGFNTTPTNGPLARNYTLAAGLDWLRADFGFDAPAGVTATIGDTVFFDADGDGTQDPGESGIAGVTVRILDSGGNVVGTDIADGSGNYDFVGLIPGSYRVEVTDIALVLTGLNLSAGVNPTAPIAVGGGDNVDTADFGYTASGGAGSIGNFVWHDIDGSGDVTGTEASLGLQGITIDLYVDVNGNGVLDAGIDNRVRTVVTTVTGEYEFNGLPAADYLVHVTDTSGVLAGFAKTSGAAGVDNNSQTDPYAITLAAGATNFTADFGYRAAGTNQISGTTFFDIDGNGLMDGLDNGVRDVTVFLYRDLDGDGVLDVGDPRIGVLISDTSGNYLFDNVPDGDFIVAVDVSGTFLASSFQTTQTATAGVQPVALAGGNSTGNDFGFNISATLVTITRFGAYESAGGVVVEWETGSEVGSLGFYVFRRDPVTDTWIQINDELLPAVNAPQGAQYRVIDDGAPARPAKLTYVIYEAEEGGGERRYGPFDVRISSEQHVANMRARFEARARRRPDAMSARIERAAGKRAEARTRRRDNRVTRQREGQLGRVAKLSTDASGIYFVDTPAVAAALEISEARVQRRLAGGRLRLSSHGEDIAWLPAADQSGLFFYAEAYDSLYSSNNVYWLAPGRGTLMESFTAEPGSGNSDYYLHHEHLEVDAFGATVASPDPDADIWYWSSLIAGNNGAKLGTYTVDVDNVLAFASPAVVEVRGFGATTTPHRLAVRINGVSIGEGSWSGVGANVVRLELDPSTLVEGTNSIEVEAVLEPGVAFDVVYIDELDLHYPRRHTAIAGALYFESPSDSEGGAALITGFDGLGDVAALDVTDARRPRWLTDFAVDGADVRLQTRAGASYFAFAMASVRAPAVSAVDSLTTLQQGRTDYLVITPEDLIEGAQELADYRASRGLRTQVVTLDTIHDEFGYGLASPHAVKAFLAHAHESWRGSPRFVVLLGKGTIDYRDNWGFGDNLNTPLLATTPLGLYASDTRLADVSGDDGVPDFMLGRIPVLSNEELSDFIDKLSAYENSGLGEALFFADNPDAAGDFTADSEGVRALIPDGVTTHRVYVGELSGPEARAALFDRLDQGVGYANYIGHGSLARLADEGLMTSSDIPLSNSMTPVLASLTCTVGRFEIPGWVSLGEALVTQPAGGTVATWAPSGLSYNQQAMILNHAFVEALYDEDTTYLGEAIQRALETYAIEGDLHFMLSIYNLLGDPATTLR